MKPLVLCILLFSSFMAYSQKDSIKIKKLMDLAYSYEKNDLDSAIYTYKQAAKLSQEINYWIGAGRATSYIGIVYSDYGMHDSAIAYHKRSIPLYEKANYQDGMASSLINLGNVYQFKGDYGKSSEYYVKGIDAYEKMKDTVRLIYAYGNFASLFTDFKIFEKSKYYQSKALDFSYRIHDSISVAYLLNDLGSTHLSLQEKDSALIKLQQAQMISDKLDDVELKYFMNNSLYNYFIEEKDFLTAYSYADKSYKNAINTRKPYYECQALNSLGNVSLELKNFNEALLFTNKALDIALKISAKEIIMEAYKTLNEIYLNQNNYKEAYYSLQLYNTYRDSLIGQQQKEFISSLEQQYQVKNKDNEILKQKLTIEQNEAILQRKINESGIYLVGLGVFLFTSFLLWYRHRQKQKLHIQTVSTLNKQKELASLEALIEGEDIERSRIAKDLHDSINGNLSAIKHNLSSLSKDYLKTDDNEILNDTIEMLDNTCDQVRNISHNLVPPSLLNYGLIEAVEQFIIRINSLNSVEISFQHFGTFKPLTKKAETTVYHIIQELITNISKHSKAQKALIQINSSIDALHITVEDDGIGYDIQAVSHGLGLQNIKSRVEFLEAEMDIKSDHKGTSITIDMDLTKNLKL